jgi:hypothetical protein
VRTHVQLTGLRRGCVDFFTFFLIRTDGQTLRYIEAGCALHKKAVNDIKEIGGRESMRPE